MIHTPKIERAIHKASILHRKQVRKGEDELPHLTHLFSVFVILAKYTHDEDILIAGLLHDTLEDTVYTADELEKDFGPRIRSIVEGVTIKKSKSESTTDLKAVKLGYIEGLRAGSKESLHVSGADKIHNFTSIFEGYKGREEDFKKDFKSEDRIHFYSKVVDAIAEGLGEDHALSIDLREVFEKYKSFLERIYTVV